MTDRSIHINCDMGESYGRYTLIDDATLMPYIDACNIACGFHAGDPIIIESTLKKAIIAGIEIGAHPSYPDRDGFGRRYMDISENDLTALIKYQIAAIQGIVRSMGGDLHHVKAHGALYNQAAKSLHEARAVARAVSSISKDLVLYAPYGSIQREQGIEFGLKVYCEAFIDRRYNQDGSLVSRKLENAIIKDPGPAWEQVQQIHLHNKVNTVDNRSIPLKADTYCIHGDNPNALSILQNIQSEKSK